MCNILPERFHVNVRYLPQAAISAILEKTRTKKLSKKDLVWLIGSDGKEKRDRIRIRTTYLDLGLGVATTERENLEREARILLGTAGCFMSTSSRSPPVWMLM